MEYKVIHLIEAAEGTEEIEYSQLVERCRQIFRSLCEKDECRAQIFLTVSDQVKEISMENGQWPGDAAFRRPRRRMKIEKNEKKVCFEAALDAAAVHMRGDGTNIVILYTAGAIRRSKRTLLAKWKKSLTLQPILLAIKTNHADSSFLQSYSEPSNVFDIGETKELICWLDETIGVSKKPSNISRKKGELWEIIRDCFL